MRLRVRPWRVTTRRRRFNERLGGGGKLRVDNFSDKECQPSRVKRLTTTFNSMLNRGSSARRELSQRIPNVGRKIDKPQCSAVLRCHIQGRGVHLFLRPLCSEQLVPVLQSIRGGTLKQRRSLFASPEAFPGWDMSEDFRKLANCALKAARIDLGSSNLGHHKSNPVEEVHLCVLAKHRSLHKYKRKSEMLQQLLRQRNRRGVLQTEKSHHEKMRTVQLRSFCICDQLILTAR